MHMFSSTLLMAPTGEGGGGYSSLIFLVLIMVVFYFFFIRPQAKKLKTLRNTVKPLKKAIGL